MKRVALGIAAMSSQLSDDKIDFSQSLASRLHRPGHAKVLSTTQRREMTTKPVVAFGRLTISIVGLGSMLSRSHATLSPANHRQQTSVRWWESCRLYQR